MYEKILETKGQEKRRMRNEAIVSRFQSMKAEFPEAKDWRICEALEKEFDLGAAQIRIICKSSGVC